MLKRIGRLLGVIVVAVLSAGAQFAMAQTVTVEVIDGAANELGLETATFRFSRTGSTAAALRVEVTFDATTTATQGTDWTDNNGGFFRSFGQVNIPANEAFFDLVITPVADNLTEPEERIDITLAPGSYTIGAAATAAATITDDPPVVTVTATDSSATEGADTATFRFERSGGNLAAQLRVEVTFDATTTATQGTDWTDNNGGFFRSFGQVNIPANEAFFDLVVTAAADNLTELDELIDITLADGDYTIGSPNTASITLIDDAPIVTVAATDNSATEGGDTATFRFERSGGNLAAQLRVEVTFDATTTATQGTDWTDNNGGFFRSFGQVNIPANEAFFDIIISASSDTINEAEEHIDITLATGNYLIGTPDSASVVIIDDLILSDGFEGLGNRLAKALNQSCNIGVLAKTDPARFHDEGPTIVDLDTGLMWLRCATDQYFDWLERACASDEFTATTKQSNAILLKQFNASRLGDNGGFNDWRFTKPATSTTSNVNDCLAR